MAQDIHKINGTYARAAARLCNFETGKSGLTLSHLEFLDSEVRIAVQSKGAWVYLFGYASRAGSFAANMKLSIDRIDVVKARIAQYAHGVNFQVTSGAGEMASGPNEHDNSGFYRAVEVYVYGVKPGITGPPQSKSSLRRIISRSFYRLQTESDMPKQGGDNLQADALKQIIRLGKDLLTGKNSEVGSLGDEKSRRIAEFPSYYRVNKVMVDKEVMYQTHIGGNTTQMSTTVTYEWGPPLHGVTVQTRYCANINGATRPDVNETKMRPRVAAEWSSLLVPPDPL